MENIYIRIEAAQRIGMHIPNFKIKYGKAKHIRVKNSPLMYASHSVVEGELMRNTFATKQSFEYKLPNDDKVRKAKVLAKKTSNVAKGRKSIGFYADNFTDYISNIERIARAMCALKGKHFTQVTDLYMQYRIEFIFYGTKYVLVINDVSLDVRPNGKLKLDKGTYNRLKGAFFDAYALPTNLF